MEKRGAQTKNKFLRHHIAGLGDGKFHVTDEKKKQDLGLPQPILETQDINRHVRTREGRKQVSPYDPPDVLDRAVNSAVGVPFVPKIQEQEQTEGQYNRYEFRAAATADDGPWQVSILALLGIIAILVVLFLHLIRDTQTKKSASSARPHYGHHTRRTRRRDQHSASFHTTKKKKTDEWSEDEVMSEVDQSYQADNEGQYVAGSSSTSHVAPVPLYYPHDYKLQQQHRQRKQASMAASSNSGVSCIVQATGVNVTKSPNQALSVIDSRPYYHHRNSQTGESGARIYATGSEGYSPDGTSLPGMGKAKQPQATVVLPRYGEVEEGLGTGLEGFSSVANSTDNRNTAVGLSTPRQQPGEGERMFGVNRTQNLSQNGISSPVVGTNSSTMAPAAHEISGPRRHLLGTPSPFQSFESLPLDIPKESTNAAATLVTSGAKTVFQQQCTDLEPKSVQGTYHLESSPGLRNRRIGDDRTRSSVEVQPGSYDHDFTPRVDNVKKKVVLPKASRKSHDSDVESASGDFLPPPPLYSSAEEEEDRRSSLNWERDICDAVDDYPGSQDNLPEDRIVLSSSDQVYISQAAQMPHQLPMLPDLKFDDGSRDTSETQPNIPLSISVGDLSRPPRSVSLEELHLIKMESGDVGGDGARWKVGSAKSESAFVDQTDTAQTMPKPTPLQPQQNTPALESQELEHRRSNEGNPSPRGGHVASQETKHGSKRPVLVAGGNESQIQLMKEIAAQRSQPNTGTRERMEPPTPIQHKRTNVTEWSDASASLTLPIDFSELELKSVIGGGGFGQVWKATWRGTPVAVKILASSAQLDNVLKSVLEEFASEINLLSGMRHPNICLYMGACLVPPNRAIVTEYAAHGSLWDALRSPLDPPYTAADGVTRNAWPLSLYYLPSQDDMNTIHHEWYDNSSKLKAPVPPRGAWPWVLIKHVATGAVRGMTYLHGGKPPVLHRDLKSANLLLDESYTTKVADFGLSRIKAQERSMTGNCGTVQWMAPEILANQSYAEPADVYSFGIILWEMLTQECPFEGMSPIQCALAVLNEHAKPKIPEWCPTPFAALIDNCIDRNPALRPTFSQILSALDSIPQ